MYKIGYHLIAILEIEKSLVALSQCSVKRDRARRVQMCAVNFRVVKRDLFEIFAVLTYSYNFLRVIFFDYTLSLSLFSASDPSYLKTGQRNRMEVSRSEL